MKSTLTSPNVPHSITRLALRKQGQQKPPMKPDVGICQVSSLSLSIHDCKVTNLEHQARLPASVRWRTRVLMWVQGSSMTWPVMFLFVPWHSSRAFCTTVLCTGSGLRRELPLPAAASSAWNAGLLPITTKQMPRAKGWESDRPMSPPLPFSCAHCVTSNNH